MATYTRHSAFLLFLFALIIQSCSNPSEQASEDSTLTEKPNIVWIMLEDWGYQLSCYGEPGISTPNVDKLAAAGIRYTNAFATAPVCSPSRSAMMTGFHQNYIRANQHRTNGSGFTRQPLPHGIRPMTHLLQEAGYFTCFMANRKTDMNFTHEGDLYQGEDWSEREEGQPFFAQLTFPGTHRRWQRDSINPIAIEDVQLPPYYPQTDLAKRDWANGLEAMQNVDRQVGEVLDRLEAEGLAENTLVFLIGDNGRCMPRGKQFLYDGGIQVPIIARWPGQIEAGEVSDAMVMTIDITKTILDVAGAKSTHPLHGKNLLESEIAEREFIFAARDKMDSTHDAMRAIRTEQYKLIHNLMPERAYCQYNNYKERSYPVLTLLNVMHLKGELPPEQDRFMADSKPEYELYDLQDDPYELNNLADEVAHQSVKDSLLTELNQWREKINDQGVSDEFRQGGWSDTYPTKSLAEWEETLEAFRPWVFREPGETMEHPFYPNRD
ncbi:sulfatase family protein [Tunicatimonas pelagia]|uniref:sulfatase family protein n=1 Tax=Tunicatimonas pelagia TaxID=931531 RepID=UPI0026671EF2|nr:sulfatase [Tunicatimonas pelagia]WKN42920.1 sulfatase [Tunicatimonas pelagia]